MNMIEFNRAKVTTLENVRKDAQHADVGDVIFVKGMYALVNKKDIYPPGHPGRSLYQIPDDYDLVVLTTTNGYRYYGRPHIEQ